MKIIILITSVLILSGFIHSQSSFQAKKVSRQTINRHLNKKAFQSEYDSYQTKAYNSVHSLPKGYKTDASVDYTAFIQSALTKYDVVFLPNFPVKINDKGLHLKSNQVLLFQPKSKLVLKPTTKSFYSMVVLSNINNVKIFYASIEGDRYRHLGKDGQWGFGIDIKNSKNVKIYSPYITKTWGDGIYVGQLNNQPSENISIYNAVIDDVRRNGISITSARNVDILNSFISNTNGHSPESALDIEPNSVDDLIENINIKNLTTFNNKWSGILLVFEKFKSDHPKTVSVNIDGHTDNFSQKAISFHGYMNDTKTGNLSGTITLKNTNYKNNRDTHFFYKTNLSKLNIKTTNSDLVDKFNSFKQK